MPSLNHKTVGVLLLLLSISLFIILSFVKTDVDERDAELCTVYHESQKDMAACPAHTSNTSWFILVAFGIALLIGLSGLLLLLLSFGGEKSVEKKEEAIDVSKLDDDEKRIYELLKLKDGSMYQSDLIKETEFSKVKTTRILDKLEGKKVIDRKRRGMTNIVILK